MYELSYIYLFLIICRKKREIKKILSLIAWRIHSYKRFIMKRFFYMKLSYKKNLTFHLKNIAGNRYRRQAFY